MVSGGRPAPSTGWHPRRVTSPWRNPPPPTTCSGTAQREGAKGHLPTLPRSGLVLNIWGHNNFWNF